MNHRFNTGIIILMVILYDLKFLFNFQIGGYETKLLILIPFTTLCCNNYETPCIQK